MSDKIQPHHLSRKAMLYVRQSSPSQVLRNEESTRLQYGMRKRLCDLGWREIDVVDEDRLAPRDARGRATLFGKLLTGMPVADDVRAEGASGHGDVYLPEAEAMARARPHGRRD